jgi:hypothetical protein
MTLYELIKKIVEYLKKWLEENKPVDPPPLPSPSPSPPPPPPEPTEPWWENRDRTVGVVAFPLTLRDRAYISDFCRYIKEMKYNTVSVGAQTDGWAEHNSPVLPVGPMPGTAEWKANLERMLEETAREGIYVQLIPTFTHKSKGGRDPYNYHRGLCKSVIEIVKGLGVRHIFWNVMNEYIHPITNGWLKDEHIKFLGEYLKDETGFPVSSDFPGEKRDLGNGKWMWKGRYPDIWHRSFDYIAFHPMRNPEPSKEDFARIAVRWGGQHGKTILYNETVKWASTEDIERWGLKGSGNVVLRGHGTDDERKDAIRSEMINIKSAGPKSRWFFHSQWASIRCDPFGWIPKYG